MNFDVIIQFIKSHIYEIVFAILGLVLGLFVINYGVIILKILLVLSFIVLGFYFGRRINM
jgi:uncharacterized membrane protein